MCESVGLCVLASERVFVHACVRVCVRACVRAACVRTYAGSYIGDSEGSLPPELFVTLGPVHTNVRVRAFVPVWGCACVNVCAID